MLILTIQPSFLQQKICPQNPQYFAKIADFNLTSCRQAD